MARHSDLEPTRTSLNRHAYWGVAITLAIIGGLSVWAVVTEVDGAVTASGVVVVEGGPRRVQHQEGGIVHRILVKNGDHVEAGQPLLQLDGTSVEASLAVVEAQLDDALARKARLTAEASGDAQPHPVDEPGWEPTEGFAIAMSEQQTLMDARAQSLERQAERLEEQKRQLSAQLEGIARQKGAASEQLAILEQEWTGLSELLDNKLTSTARTNTNKTARSELSGQIGRLETDSAAISAAIAEKDQEIGQLKADLQAKALEELQDVTAKISELLQQRIAAKDRLARLDIRSPVAGTVHESKVQTIGGVIAPAETLMTIVPEDTDVLVDAHVSPMDVDKVSGGQPVNVRFVSFDSRVAPDVAAKVVSVSPSTSADPTTGATFYTVRIDVDDSAIPQSERDHLVPGMPSEAFIETGSRTVFSYLIKPLADQIAHTFRED
jgi:HlyD family secretion protein